jgi:hypothetical protein
MEFLEWGENKAIGYLSPAILREGMDFSFDQVEEDMNGYME